jgi:hypothetical protein
MKGVMERIAVVAVSLLLLVIMSAARRGDATVLNRHDSSVVFHKFIK